MKKDEKQAKTTMQIMAKPKISNRMWSSKRKVHMKTTTTTTCSEQHIFMRIKNST